MAVKFLQVWQEEVSKHHVGGPQTVSPHRSTVHSHDHQLARAQVYYDHKILRYSDACFDDGLAICELSAQGRQAKLGYHE